MQWRAGTALSQFVVHVDIQSRPADITETIEQSRATHAVVFDEGQCRGVVALRHAGYFAPHRPFGELLLPGAPEAISGDLSLDEAARLLADSCVDAVPVVDETGAYVGVVTGQSLLAALLRQKAAAPASSTDDSESRQFEQALRRSERHLQQVINNAPVLLFATDHNGIYTLSEGKAVLAFGARAGDAVGMSAFERYRGNPTITNSIRRALDGEEHTAVAEIRGRTFECQCTPTIGPDGSISGMIGVATDITERRQAEGQSRRLLDELAHTGRISTMGEMASGLAHELNQPLAAIVAYVDACQELVESGKMNSTQLADVLRSVSEQAERAGQIIHRLRMMIKRSQPVRATINVNDAVREVAVLLEVEARHSGVSMQLDLSDDLPEIAADFLQIQHVVLHLMRNGLEALTDVVPDQRRLTISTQKLASGELAVAVHDLGHGLTGASSEKIFEPFFTTKTNGLGLGLSVSRTIVEAHGGRLWITPNTTAGVTSRFALPASGGKAAHAQETDRLHR